MSPVNRKKSPVTLRPYQVATIEGFEAAWSGARRPTGTGVVNRAVAVKPTGTGKTVTFSELIARANDRGERAGVFVHREELAEQAKDKLHSIAPGLDVGIVKGNRDETDAPVVICSVPTLARLSRRERVGALGLVVVDECHHAAAPTWRTALEHFGAFNGLPIAGFTATLDRNDGKALGDIFEEIVFRMDITEAIAKGFLVDVRGKRIQIKDLELDEVKRSRGDYQAGDLGDALSDANAGNAIAEAYVEHCKNRPGIIFAPTVETAIEFAEEMNAAGIVTEVVTGTTPSEERAGIYERFRLGTTQVLSNCMVLTEGFDAPWAEVAVIARPTESASLYTQMVGRVLRPWPQGGKRDALVLDVCGVSEKHRLATLAELTATEVVVEEGESLAEAIERKREAEEVGLAPELRLVVTGEHVVTDVDLFARQSASMWLTTYGGTWFIPTEGAYFFLWPSKQQPGLFNLGRLPKNGQRKYPTVIARVTGHRTDAVTLEKGLTLEMGMLWAERYASDEDPSISSKSAPWRSKREPSTAQIQYLDGLGAQYGVDYTTRSEAANLLSVILGSPRIDCLDVA